MQSDSTVQTIHTNRPSHFLIMSIKLKIKEFVELHPCTRGFIGKRNIILLLCMYSPDESYQNVCSARLSFEELNSETSPH